MVTMQRPISLYGDLEHDPFIPTLAASEDRIARMDILLDQYIDIMNIHDVYVLDTTVGNVTLIRRRGMRLL